MRTNSRRLRVASSRSTFARAFGLANQEAKLLEFFIVKLGEFGRGADRDGTAVWAAMLAVCSTDAAAFSGAGASLVGLGAVGSVCSAGPMVFSPEAHQPILSKRKGKSAR